MDYWRNGFLEPLEFAKFIHYKDLNASRFRTPDTFRFCLISDNPQADQTCSNFINNSHLSAIPYLIDHGQINYKETPAFNGSQQQWMKQHHTLPTNYQSGPTIPDY
jgi:hypothetical protein